jgi:hypothetical protein
LGSKEESQGKTKAKRFPTEYNIDHAGRPITIQPSPATSLFSGMLGASKVAATGTKGIFEELLENMIK